MLEPIQGESGVHVLDERAAAGRARGLRRARGGADLRRDPDRHGPHRHAVGLRADAASCPTRITSAKALGGGLPIGALVTGERLADAFAPGDHGSTFAGGPVVAQAALQALDVTADDAAAGAGRGARRACSPQASSACRTCVEVRGRGLMLACELDVDAPAVVREALLDQRLVLNATGPEHAAAAAGADDRARAGRRTRSGASGRSWGARERRHAAGAAGRLRARRRSGAGRRRRRARLHRRRVLLGARAPARADRGGDPRLAARGRALPRRRAGRLRARRLRRRDAGVPRRRVRAAGLPGPRPRPRAGARDGRRRRGRLRRAGALDAQHRRRPGPVRADRLQRPGQPVSADGTRAATTIRRRERGERHPGPAHRQLRGRPGSRSGACCCSTRAASTRA